MKSGRKTIFDKHPDKIKELLRRLEQGQTYKTSCALASIGESTFHKWIDDAKLIEKKTIKIDVEKLSKTEKNLLEFLESVKKAEAMAISNNVLQIQLAARENWQAAGWFLERRDPENWGRKEQIKQSIEISPEAKAQKAREELSKIDKEMQV